MYPAGTPVLSSLTEGLTPLGLPHTLSRALARCLGDTLSFETFVFTSPELASRIDRTEGRLCAAFALDAPQARVIAVGGGVAVFIERDSPTNKLIGAGFSGRVEDSVLSEIDALFARHGARLQAEVSTLADPALHRQLVERGYLPSGFENVLGRSLRDVAAPSQGIRVELVASSEWPKLAVVMAEGFSNPDTGGVGGDELPPVDGIRQAFMRTLQISGFRGYLARIDGTIAGGAVLRLDTGIAQFGGDAARLPAPRCADRLAPNAPRRRGPGGLRYCRCRDATGLEVAAER